MRANLPLGLILVVAIGWRGLGLPQGYPDFYGHVDEIGVAASIWNFFREATFRPTEFTYPALYSYAVAAGVALTGLGLSPALSSGGILERLTLLSYLDPAWSALVGRSLSLCADLVTILLIHRLTRLAGSSGWAWFAALAYAVAVVPVRQAHMALPDALTAMLSTAVVWRAWCLLEGEGRWRDYLVAGGLCGLVLATKYNGALCALAVVGAHLLRSTWTVAAWRQFLDSRLWGAGLAALIAGVVACPYFLLEPGSYFGLVRYQLSSLDFALRDVSPWWWVARDFVLQEYVLGGLMLAGVVRALFRRDRFDWVLMAVTLPAFAYIGSWTRESLHYLLPYIPILIVQVARLLQEVAQRARLPSAWMSVVVGCLLLMPNAVSSLAEGIQRHRPDTRSLAAAWIAANIPDGSGIGMTWLPYCPRLQPIAARQGLESAYRNQPDALRQLQSHWRGQPSYRLVNLEVWLKEPVVPEALRAHVDLEDAETRRIFSRGWRSLRQLHRAGVQYLVLPTAAYARYLRDDLHPASVAAGFRLQLNRAYFEMLLAPTNAEIVAVIEESPATRGGAITILRLHSPEETSPVSH